MLKKYIKAFFEELEVFEDIERGHSYKAYIEEAILEFLKKGTKETAFNVYLAFFDSYRIVLKGEKNLFIDLLDVLKDYEEKASTIIDKQRDHYVHSVNVFILGLCIYSHNEGFRRCFSKTVMDKSVYESSYDTKNEEFFYRWGIASLFHDAGYPVEIIGKQINKFISFVANAVEGSEKVNAQIVFESFNNLNKIPEIQPKEVFTGGFAARFPQCDALDLLKPLDLISFRIHQAFNIDLQAVKESLDNFIFVMQKSGFVDHGFYSAIIVLKWYGYLIQKCSYKPDYLYYPVVDCASAILLHNYYRNVLMKKPFNLERLNPEKHPTAYLLILCDELQEWNREAYGILDKKGVHADEGNILITDKRLSINYLSRRGALPQSFASDKSRLLNNLLETDILFSEGITITCGASQAAICASDSDDSCSDDGCSDDGFDDDRGADIIPRPVLADLEKLAMAIHELYNIKQLERYPEKPLAYPTWESLPHDLKYSNIRQARSMAGKLKLIGCSITEAQSEYPAVTVFTTEEIEFLAKVEHDLWVEDYLEKGWKYGPVKNIENKISPYLVPYEELTEEIKELDRDTIMNTIPLLNSIGMKVYRRGSSSIRLP